MRKIPIRLADFGPFTFNLAERTLHAGNSAVDLHRRAAEILGYFIENAGRWISRDELRNQFWLGVFVAENSIDRQISDIRRVLGDFPRSPRYIETKHKYGWRFIASVHVRTVSEPAGTPEQSAEAPAGPALAGARTPARGVPHSFRLALVILFAAAGTAAGFWFASTPEARVTASVQLTNDGRPKIGPLLSSGKLIYFTEELETGAHAIFSLAAAGGEPVPINIPLRDASLQDISRRGTILLLESQEGGGGNNLWAYSLSQRTLTPVQAGSAFGAFSRNGLLLAATTPDQLAIQILGKQAKKRIVVPGRAFDLKWSPDSRKLRFSLEAGNEESTAEWEIARANLMARPLPKLSQDQKYVLGGAWSNDGKYFFYSAGTQVHRDIWVSRENEGLLPIGRQGPWRLTHGGPGSWGWPGPSSHPSMILALNTSTRPELVRFDARTGTWKAKWGGAAAYELNYSRDLNYVAYTNFRDHTIWKARPDGSERTRLTQPGIEAHQPHWSPDGARIAFMGKNAKQEWRVFEISAHGGEPIELLPSGPDQGVPTWSPDGRFLYFGDLLGRRPRPQMCIHVLEVSDRKLTDLPGSKGLWSTRWSPDGRYLSATMSDYKAIRIAPPQGAPWRELVRMRFADNATWSPDSRYIYFNGIDYANHRWLFRVSVPGGKLERIADLADFQYAAENWHGVGRGGVALALRGVSMQEIYSLKCILP